MIIDFLATGNQIYLINICSCTEHAVVFPLLYFLFDLRQRLCVGGGQELIKFVDELNMAESGSTSCGVRCRSGVSAGWGALVSTAFEYDTPKIVHIKNKKVGILNRLVQLAILGYVIV